MSIDNDVIGKKNTSFGVIKDTSRQMPDGYLSKTPMFQYILVSICFPMWGAAASLNDILITQFKTIFTLSDFASAFVQSAFYGGYFLLAIPASRIIRKWSYKSGILIGLCFYIIGCTMFFPASHMATYSVFLAALFAIATGLSFLETSCNTYSSMLGPRRLATLRLNISQTFYRSARSSASCSASTWSSPRARPSTSSSAASAPMPSASSLSRCSSARSAPTDSSSSFSQSC
ncbi:MFS transporter [Trueperella bernardiae]|uniref:hypothetical protein n=1 Tax=Trueperella bernardiae TaxID=59561 RepID=UPI00374E300C